MDYLYPEELSKIFMTCNLVTGMFQRIEKLRKYAFASICIFGEDNANVISGIWVWRGQELVFPLVPDWNVDAPSYKFEKLDPNAESTKEMVKVSFRSMPNILCVHVCRKAMSFQGGFFFF